MLLVGELEGEVEDVWEEDGVFLVFGEEVGEELGDAHVDVLELEVVGDVGVEEVVLEGAEGDLEVGEEGSYEAVEGGELVEEGGAALGELGGRPGEGVEAVGGFERHVEEHGLEGVEVAQSLRVEANIQGL